MDDDVEILIRRNLFVRTRRRRETKKLLTRPLTARRSILLINYGGWKLFRICVCVCVCVYDNRVNIIVIADLYNNVQSELRATVTRELQTRFFKLFVLPIPTSEWFTDEFIPR